MDELLKMLGEMQIPFAYDHFAEGESRTRPSFAICFPAATTSPQMAGSTTRFPKCISRSTPI